ncbi:MAG: O-antigen ligase family protein [Minisyncoccia bacterium]|jgi:O-antigen ligase
MTQEEKSILFLIKIILFLIPFSLLLVCPGFFCPFNLFFPYITGKAIYFRILIEIAFALTLILILKNINYLPKKNEYIFWSAILLILINLILIPFSLRPYLSFWGNAERMEGFWGLFHFVLWFLVLYIIFRIDSEFKKTIFYSLLIVHYLVSLKEISQYIQGTIRPDSTFGNATFVGFFSILVIFISLYFLKGASNLEKLLIFIAIIFSIANIIISETRGSILALGIALPISLLYYFLTSNVKLTYKVLFLVTLIFLLIFFYYFINSEYAKYIPGIRRIYDTLRDPRAYMARYLAWGIFINAWKEKPILGYGLENSPIAYFKAFNPEIYNYEEVIFDRPHNKYIEILVTTGIVGATVWFLFILSIFWTIFKNLEDRYSKAVFLGFILAYLGQNLTLFDIQASYIPFFLGLSILAPKINLSKERKSYERLSLIILIYGLLGIGIMVNLVHFYFVYEIIKAIQAPYPDGLEKFEKLISYNTQFIPEIAVMTSRYVEGNIAKVRSLYEVGRITQIYIKALEKDPYDARIYNILTLHLSRVVNAERLSKLDYQNDLNLLYEIFRKYMELYPKYPDIQMQYASILQSLGETEKAKEILENLRITYRDSTRVIYLLANLYYQIGDKEKALELLKENFARKFYPQTPVQYLIAIRILKNTQNLDEANKLIEEYKNKFKDRDSIEMLNEILKQNKKP